MGFHDALTEQHQRNTLTAVLLDMAGGRAGYETDATFRAQVDMLIVGLPAMVRALAEEVPRRQAAIRAATDLLAKAHPITADEATRLIRETGVTLIDPAEDAEP